VDARAITAALSGKWQGKYGLCRCPVHSDRTPSLKVSDSHTKSDGVDLFCFAGCDWKDIKDDLRRQGILPEFSAGEVHHLPRGLVLHHHDHGLQHDNDGGGRQGRAMKIWKAATPLAGTLGLRYLREARGIEISFDVCHALRFHEYSAAIIALMTDPVSGDAVGIHRTFLKDDGTKRERKMLGRAGVVRLSPDVTLGLGISEGIEDALSVIASGWSPVWAALSCGGIERLPVLSGIEALTIFHDRDEAGVRAAEICAERWSSAGREVFLA
jgi:hypothetical protein